MAFYPIKTNDGSISLYNFDVSDVYHSKVGAYTEALNKYVIPLDVINFADKNKNIKVLDVCYGLGYNSKTLVNEILKHNINCNISLTILDIDPNVLAFSCLIGDDIFQDEVNQAFNAAIFENLDVKKTLEIYLDNIIKKWPDFKTKIPAEYECLSQDEIRNKLHNIYYQTISSRNNIKKVKPNTPYSVSVSVHINDARKSVIKLQGEYDFILLDPFTPSKAPQLCTVDFFKELYRLTSTNGKIATYSSSAPVRSAFIEAGFNIGISKPVGKKTTGTIAAKNKDLIKYELSEKEKGILDTKAGISYKDKSLSSTKEKILTNWEAEKSRSDRISSSQFLKLYKKQNNPLIESCFEL